MASHTSDDDEDYGDDPIKLFDSSEDAVYFGSKAYEKSTTTIDFTWKSEKTLTDPECASPIESNSGETSDIMRQLSVKLVDCGQFPWYYRKYTQQILDLTGIDLDSDSEVDVEGLDNNDENDCIVVEGLKNVSNNKTNVMNSMESVLAAMRLSTREKRQNTLRLKEEIEIQRALSLKNTTKVDLKLNQGLVGMKIKNLPLLINFKNNKKVNKLDLKQGDKNVGDLYLHAADKVLQHIGTELIPIGEHKHDKSQGNELSTSVTHTIEGSKKTAIEESTCSTKASQKNINKICEQLLDSIKTKKICKVTSTNIQITGESNVFPNTDPTKEISKLETIPKAVTSDKSQKNVKDVTKTNKFKNDQLKNQSKALIELLISKPTDNKTEVSNKSDQIQVEACAINETHKNIDDKSKCEPNSPILPSSNLSIKSKSKLGTRSKCVSVNSFCNASQGSDNLNNNKSSFTELFSGESDGAVKSGKGMNNSENSKDLKSKESFLLKDLTISRVHHDIHPKFIKVSEKEVKKSNDGTGTNLKNITPNYKDTITNSHKDSVAVMKKKASVDSRKKAIVANQNVVVADNMNTKYERKDEKNISGIASIKNNSLSNGTENQNFNDMTTHVATLGLPCHSYKPTHTSKTNFSNQNCVHDMKTNLGNPNSFEHNSFPITSYMAQKPNIQTTTPQVHQPGLFQAENGQRTNIIRKPMHIPVHSQPRCPYYQKSRIQFNSELPCRYSQYIPSHANNTQFPTNKSMQNYFPYFRGSVYPGRNPVKSQHVNNDWQTQNTASFVSSLTPQLTPQNSTLHGNSGPQYFGTPFHSTVQISQNAPASINPTYAHYLKKNNCPVISNEKDNLKKTNINLIPNKDDAIKIKHKLEEMRMRNDTPNANAEVVATKTEMLKELDKLSFDDNAKNDLKRKFPDETSEIKRTSSCESSDVLKKTKVNDTFKTPVVTNRNDSKIELQSKYSPPILPIPRYDKVLEHISSDPRGLIDNSNITADKVSKQKFTSEIKPVQNTHKRCRKRISHEFKEPSCIRKKLDGKKISLEEYKQRVYVKSTSELSKRRMGKDNDKYKHGPGPKMYKKYSNHNPESDLGYDSDSTVVL